MILSGRRSEGFFGSPMKERIRVSPLLLQLTQPISQSLVTASLASYPVHPSCEARYISVAKQPLFFPSALMTASTVFSRNERVLSASISPGIHIPLMSTYLLLFINFPFRSQNKSKSAGKFDGSKLSCASCVYP